jgi:hypothetical protein
MAQSLIEQASVYVTFNADTEYALNLPASADV